MHSKIRKSIKFFLILLFIVLVCGLICGFYYIKQNRSNLERIQTEIEYKGETLAKENEIVSQIRTDRARRADLENQLISGNYSPDLKVAFLTFDDGPNKSSNEVLDILDRYGVKGTFFTNEFPGPENEAVLKRIVAEGHTLANHTADHDYTLYNSPASFYQNIIEQENFLRNVTGQEPVKLMRFPGGSNLTDESVINGVLSMGYNYVDWDSSTGDGAPNILPTDQVVNKVMGEIAGKQTPVILMHAENPAKTTSREALPIIIENLQQQGYEILPIDPRYQLKKFI